MFCLIVSNSPSPFQIKFPKNKYIICIYVYYLYLLNRGLENKG